MVFQAAKALAKRLEKSTRTIAPRLMLRMLGKSSVARARLVEFIRNDATYRGPLATTRTRTLVACGDHLMWIANGDTGVGQGLLKTGAWQRDDFDAAMAIISAKSVLKDKIFLDIGANIGTQSLYAALSGQFAQIVAIEPDATNANMIRDNCAMNALETHVHVIQKAAGSKSGRIFLNSHADDSGMHTTSDVQTDHSLSVEMETIPAILANLGINARDIGFIWMDIEGYEFNVFPTLVENLKARCPILFEHSRQSLSDAQHLHWSQFLESCGYACFEIRRGKAVGPLKIADALNMRFGNILLV